MKNLKFTIITFYQFKKNSNVERLQNLLKNFCSFNKIKGTILLAEEGINGTVAGLIKPINLLELEIQKMGFTKLEAISSNDIRASSFDPGASATLTERERFKFHLRLQNISVDENMATLLFPSSICQFHRQF